MRIQILEKSAKRPRLAEGDIPRPGPGQVLVRTTAVGLHPVDVETADGGNAMVLPVQRPFIPGVDFVGWVEALGQGTEGFRAGERVYGYRGIATQGAFAACQCVQAGDLALAPEGATDRELATLPLPALCALQALDEAGLTRPGRVLVHGGAGGVGSIAVQVYARLGHEVTATASAADAQWVQDLGASRVIDFKSERFDDLVTGQDLVLDTIGGEVLTRSFRVVAPGGFVCSLRAMPTAATMRAAGLHVPWFFGPLLPLMRLRTQRQADAAGAHLVGQVTVPSGARLEKLRLLIGDRPFQVRIHQALPFDKLGEGLDLIATGKARGRVIVHLA